MTKVKLDLDSMRVISLLESVTRVQAKDCIIGEDITFVIRQEDMGKAIGKGGSTIKRIETMLKKKVLLIEYTDNIVTFVRKLIGAVPVDSIEVRDGVLVIDTSRSKTKGKIMGRNRMNIDRIKGLVTKYFPIKDVTVV